MPVPLRSMENHAKYLRYTWFVFYMVLLVIIAGGVVRMTQSGMGCPDWPTCFGRWIPPTDASQLPPDFEKYLRQQDIDHTFNVYHTWIEYINRLLGALLGVFLFIHFVWTFLRYRHKRSILFLSGLLLVLTGFQGWLGKKVVDANLEVVKVTIHMLVALVIAALPLMIIFRLKDTDRLKNRFLKYFSLGMLVVLVIQIILGTEVREQIDIISKSLAYSQRELWIGRLDAWFLVHRSLSWLIVAAAFVVFWRSRPLPRLSGNGLLILLFALCSVIAGITMMWWNIPALTQPLHLLSGTLLALSVFAFNIRLKS